MTFLVVEQYVVTGLRDRIIETADSIDLDDIRSIISRRRDGHWSTANLPSTPNAPREGLHAVYDALVVAAELFGLHGRYRNGFDYGSAKALIDAYTNDLFRFDQLYRLFCEHAEHARSEGWDVLKGLSERVEALYGNWYLLMLALKWNDFLDPAKGHGLLKSWQLDGNSEPTAILQALRAACSRKEP